MVEWEFPSEAVALMFTLTVLILPVVVASIVALVKLNSAEGRALVSRPAARALTTVAATALIAASAANAAGSTSVFVIPLPNLQPTRMVQRPTTVEFFMTGGDWLTNLRWTSWGGAQAVATGTVHMLLCKPDCASGQAYTYPGRLVLSSRCSRVGRTYYTHASYTYKRDRRTVQGHNLGEPPCGPL
jgi:hypothetical protein